MWKCILIAYFVKAAFATPDVAFLIFDSQRIAPGTSNTYADMLHTSLQQKNVSETRILRVHSKDWEDKVQNLPQRHGDSEKRIKWRSSLVLDYIDAMKHALNKFPFVSHICRLEVRSKISVTA